LEKRGFRADAVDIRIGGEAHNLGSPQVQAAVLGRIAAREFAFVFVATPCAPYSVARGGSNSPELFDAAGPIEPCPPGWEEYRARHIALALFTAEVLRAGESVGAACMLVNPADISDPLSPAYWPARAGGGSLSAPPT
jgi:hypothetical protein